MFRQYNLMEKLEQKKRCSPCHSAAVYHPIHGLILCGQQLAHTIRLLIRYINDTLCVIMFILSIILIISGLKAGSVKY